MDVTILKCRSYKRLRPSRRFNSKVRHLQYRCPLREKVESTNKDKERLFQYKRSIDNRDHFRDRNTKAGGCSHVLILTSIRSPYEKTKRKYNGVRTNKDAVSEINSKMRSQIKSAPFVSEGKV